jgi:hypothetical protein
MDISGGAKNMMLLVTILCAGAAAILSAIVFNLPSLSSIKAFLLSFLVAFICGLALAAKEAAVKKGTSFFARLLAFVVTGAILTTAAQPYMNVWRETHGFWPVVFLLWLAWLAFVMLWLPLRAGGEKLEEQ